MQGLSRILSIFRKEFNKFNNRSMNVRFYLLHDIKITFKDHIFGEKMSRFCHHHASHYVSCPNVTFVNY